MAIFTASFKSEDNIKSLEDYQGTYHGWLTFARSLKGKRSEDNPLVERKPRSRKLSDKGVDRLLVGLSAANDAQIVDLFSEATQSMVAREHGEAVTPILLVIQKQAELLARTKEFPKSTQSIGHKILEIVVPALAQVESKEYKKVVNGKW